MDEKILNCENDLRVIESIVEDIEKKIERRVRDAKTQSQKELDKLITDRVDDFSNALNQVEASASVSTEVKAIYESHLTATTERIQNLLNTYFEELYKMKLKT